jgi:hypothetical protein
MAYSKGTADKQWIAGFMKSHPKLSLRQLEYTSLLGATRFNKILINKFFDVLKHFVDDNKITVSRVFNMHETLRTAMQRPEKMIAQPGNHQVRAITYCGRQYT